MSSPQAVGFAKNIRDKLHRLGSIKAAANELKAELESMGFWSDDNEAALVEAIAIVEAEYRPIENLIRHSVIRVRQKWYGGPQEHHKHWPSLKTYLIHRKKWLEDTVNTINDLSSEIVGQLDDPSTSDFSCRGLVVGYVQSGKTANMTAVIAKAVDAGYNMVFVLAGLTNKLRQQTQRRLETDILDTNPTLWHRLTKSDLDGDFQGLSHGGFIHIPDRAQLAVVKKNVAPLRRFLETIKKTVPAELKHFRVLIIDDECDQASVNSASKETDMTRINEQIREILKALPAVSYVGYTATPFANVLINPYADSTEVLDDLYPKDFITALPMPDGYFGTERLFGRPTEDADNPSPEEEGLDMIRTIPESDESLIQPPSAKERESFVPTMAGSLQKAVLYFLATCAARRYRGQGDQHMTMLVHTSAYIAMHQRVAGLIDTWIGQIDPSLRSGRGEYFDRLSEIWAEEAGKLPESITEESPVSLEELAPFLGEVLDGLSVPIENGASDDRIDYSGDAKTYIVVGGTVLARGLTLEGLCVSYFLRSSSQYDTLLQMGRWFGYRFGYEDLPRIWMPDSLQVSFRALAGIEAEIRQDIDEYCAETNVTPMEFAVRIRTIPGMAITARNKMRYAESCDISYWGRHIQTIRFPRTDGGRLDKNWEAGSTLVATAEGLGLARQIGSRLLMEDVPKRAINLFLRDYQISDSHKDLSSEMLLGFTDQEDDRLALWNVVLMQPSRGASCNKAIGSRQDLLMYSRTRLRGVPEEIGDIKALMSKRDILADCPVTDEGDRDLPDDWRELKRHREALIGSKPLLLLYPIDKDSEPSSKALKNREKLAADRHVLGFGMVFPGSTDYAGKYVSVNLQPISAEELDNIEQEELNAAKMAGID